MRTIVNCVPHEWCITELHGTPKLTFFDDSVDSEVVVDLRHLPALAEALERLTIRQVRTVE